MLRLRLSAMVAERAIESVDDPTRQAIETLAALSDEEGAARLYAAQKRLEIRRKSRSAVRDRYSSNLIDRAKKLPVGDAFLRHVPQDRRIMDAAPSSLVEPQEPVIFHRLVIVRREEADPFE